MDDKEFDVENSDELTKMLAKDTEEEPEKESEDKESDKGEQESREPAKKPDDEETTEEKVEDKEEEPEQKKPPSRAKRRIQRQQAKIKKLEEEVKQLKTEKKEINIDDFENYEDYVKALEEAKDDEKEEKSTQQEAFDQEDIDEIFDEGISKYDDFDTLVTAPDLALTEDVISDVIESEKASDILYHLAKNKDETLKIARMSDRDRKKALLKIEISLEKKKSDAPKKKISSAPEPIKPVGGDAPKTVSLDDNDLSYEEYEKEFQRQQSKRRKNGWL